MSDNDKSRIARAAHDLVIAFTEEAGLPLRFRKSYESAPSRKIRETSEVEKRYRANIASWKQLIETMLARKGHHKAWSFIDLSPEIQPTVRQLTDCGPFCEFVDYVRLRRDEEMCSSDEVGGLALLLTAFQRKIEMQIRSVDAGSTAD